MAQVFAQYPKDPDYLYYAYEINKTNNVVSREGLNEHEWDQEDRRAGLKGRADKATSESASRYGRAMQQIEGIEPGQPILVGHHSEKRHRRDLDRHDSHMRAAIDADKKAAHYQEKAAGVGTGGVSSDDTDAIAKLRNQLAQRVERQECYRRMNKVWRALKKNPDSPATVRALARLNDTERLIVENYEAQYSWEKGPAQDYQLSNNNAEIRRLKKRIEDLHRAEQRVAAEPIRDDGFVIIENTEENRIQIIFDGKPEKAVRVILKNHSFRWAPSSGAWQRQPNHAGIHAAQQVKRQLKERGAE